MSQILSLSLSLSLSLCLSICVFSEKQIPESTTYKLNLLKFLNPPLIQTHTAHVRNPRKVAVNDMMKSVVVGVSVFLGIFVCVNAEQCSICLAKKDFARCVEDFEGKKITSGCVEVKFQSHAAKLRFVEVHACDIHIRNVFGVVIRDNKGEECIGKLTKKIFLCSKVSHSRSISAFDTQSHSSPRHFHPCTT